MNTITLTAFLISCIVGALNASGARGSGLICYGASTGPCAALGCYSAINEPCDGMSCDDGQDRCFKGKESRTGNWYLGCVPNILCPPGNESEARNWKMAGWNSDEGAIVTTLYSEVYCCKGNKCNSVNKMYIGSLLIPAMLALCILSFQ